MGSCLKYLRITAAVSWTDGWKIKNSFMSDNRDHLFFTSMIKSYMPVQDQVTIFLTSLVYVGKDNNVYNMRAQ